MASQLDANFLKVAYLTRNSLKSIFFLGSIICHRGQVYRWICSSHPRNVQLRSRPSTLHYLYGRNRRYRWQTFFRRNLCWSWNPTVVVFCFCKAKCRSQYSHGIAQSNGRLRRARTGENDHGDEQTWHARSCAFATWSIGQKDRNPYEAHLDNLWSKLNSSTAKWASTTWHFEDSLASTRYSRRNWLRGNLAHVFFSLQFFSRRLSSSRIHLMGLICETFVQKQVFLQFDPSETLLTKKIWWK